MFMHAYVSSYATCMYVLDGGPYAAAAKRRRSSFFQPEEDAVKKRKLEGEWSGGALVSRLQFLCLFSQP